MFSKLQHWLGATLLLGILSGCGDEITSPSVSAQTNNETPASATHNRLTVSDQGIGPINGKTRFNIHDIGLDFPNYSVVEELNFQEGDSYPVIRISKDAKRIMTINPTMDLKSIYSVIIEDNLVTNSLSHRLGTVFSDIYTDETNNFKCQAGVEEMSGQVLCIPPKSSNLLYLFTGKWNGPDGEIPPTAILYGWSLESIIWKP